MSKKPSKTKEFNKDESEFIVDLLWDARAYAEHCQDHAQCSLIDNIGEKMGMDPGWYEKIADASEECCGECESCHCCPDEPEEKAPAKPEFLN